MPTPPCGRLWPSIHMRIRPRGTNAHQILTNVPGSSLPLIRSGLSVYGIWSRSGGTGSTASSCVTAIAEPSWAPAVSTAKNLSRVVQVCRPALVQWGAPEAVVSDRTGVFLALNPCRQQLGIRWSPMPRGTPGKISPKGALPSGAECSMPMWLAAPTAGLSAAGDVRPGRSVLAPWGA
jgi:hypothetical protein